MNELTSVTEKNSPGTTLYNAAYILNADGSRASAHEVQLQADNTTSASIDSIWTYDADGRLTVETVTSSLSGQSFANTFTFDLAANRITETHTGPGGGGNDSISYVYDARNELTSQTSTLNGTTTLTYDANGSQVTSTMGGSVTTYTFDVRNKMVTVAVDGVTKATYVYDDGGNRVQETTTDGTTYYLTDPNNPTGYTQPIEARPSPTAAPTTTYILGDRVLAQANSSGAVTYFLIDSHGSTRVLTDSSGAVAAALNYDAFGGAIGFDASAPPPIFLFGGDAVYDPASGLYLHGDGVRGRMQPL